METWKNPREALRTVCRADRSAVRRISKKTDCSTQAVYSWFRRKAPITPRPEIRPLIEEATNGAVRAWWWLSPDERAALQSSLASVHTPV